MVGKEHVVVVLLFAFVFPPRLSFPHLSSASSAPNRHDANTLWIPWVLRSITKTKTDTGRETIRADHLQSGRHVNVGNPSITEIEWHNSKVNDILALDKIAEQAAQAGKYEQLQEGVMYYTVFKESHSSQ